MNDSKEEEKIEKLAAKRKSDAIIKIMQKADADVVVTALGALATVGDEAACNEITHYIDAEERKVRIAACKAALTIKTEYMNTRVRHQIAEEKDPEVKAAIQAALNAK